MSISFHKILPFQRNNEDQIGQPELTINLGSWEPLYLALYVKRIKQTLHRLTLKINTNINPLTYPIRPPTIRLPHITGLHNLNQPITTRHQSLHIPRISTPEVNFVNTSMHPRRQQYMFPP